MYGFSTQSEALPERKLEIAAASALDGSNEVVARLAEYALRLMFAAQDRKSLPASRLTGPVPPERAKELFGTYRVAKPGPFTRTTELNGTLFMQRGVFRTELRSATDDGSILTDDVLGFGTEVKRQDKSCLSLKSPTS